MGRVRGVSRLHIIHLRGTDCKIRSWVLLGLRNKAFMADRKASILVVEDEPIIRMALADHIESEGFDVIESGSGELAKEILQAGKPIDLMVTDVQMPGWLDGIGLALWTRQNHPQIKIIIVSGATSEAPSLAALGSEGIIIPKPYSVEEIAGQIRRLLDESVD
jgi:DNA-binding response OmpR family regulator